MRLTLLRFAGSVLSFTFFCVCVVGINQAQSTWVQTGTPICTESHFQSPTAIVSDAAKGAIVVWTDFRASGDIYAQRVDSTGVIRWTTDGVSVCSAAFEQFNAQATPYAGGAVVFWQDFRNGSHDVYAQRIDDLGSPKWTLDGIPLGTTSNAETVPLAISDFSLGLVFPVAWIVAWRSIAGSNVEVRMQRVNADGVGLWTPAASGGVLLASQTGSLSPLVMAPDGVFASPHRANGAVVAWSNSPIPAPTGHDVYARRIDRTGVPQWAANGVAVCALSGDQRNPSIVHVGGGNVIIAWDDTRTGDRDIMAQKLNSSGTAQWLAGGVPICQVSGAQSTPKLVPDGAGGVIAVWQDSRSGVSKIYAQRLDGNGLRLWPVDGVPVSYSSGHLYNPEVVSDGSGGVIVAWHVAGVDEKKEDIYAQRLDGSGSPLWPAPDGILLTHTADQEGLVLTPDGYSGAIAAWADTRTGFDVYGSRITSIGLVDVPMALPKARRLVFTSSNPARGEVRMRLELPEPAVVTAEVLDVSGRRVSLLVAGAGLGAGTHAIDWDGCDSHGRPVTAGVYFVRVRTGGETLLNRVVRLR